LKALSLTAMALWVLGSTAYHVIVLGMPRAEIMGAIGILALAANVASVLMFMRYKDGDANVRSVWLCSRNDAIGNVAVMAAALAVWGTATKWPDLLVAAIMAGLFLTSSIQICGSLSGNTRRPRRSCRIETDAARMTNVRFWPLAEIPSYTAYVRFRGQSGHGPLQCKCPLMTQSGHFAFI
jgi:Co/Zn/Cd efflux system component